MRQRGGRLAWAIALAWYAVVALVTLQPSVATINLPMGCIFCGPLGGVDFVLNTVLFVPIGFSLRRAFGHSRAALAVGMLSTLVIETLQWRFIPGRDASMGDLVANSLGTVLGVWLAVTGMRWLNARNSQARRPAATFGVLAFAVVIASAELLQPVEPRYAMHVQWKPERPHMDTFGGRLLAVSLNDRPLRPIEVTPMRFADSASTRVTAILGAPVFPTTRQAIIVRIANELEEGFFLGQWEDLATFRTYTRGNRWKLRSLLVGLPEGLSPVGAGVPGSTGEFTIIAESNPRAISIKREQLDGQISMTIPRTVGLGWTLLFPWEVAVTPKLLPINALWLGALMIPVSFFTGRLGVSRWPQAIGVWPLLLSLGSVIASPVTGLSPLIWVEWAGVVAGIAVGASLASLARRPIEQTLRGTGQPATMAS